MGGKIWKLAASHKIVTHPSDGIKMGYEGEKAAIALATALADKETYRQGMELHHYKNLERQRNEIE